MYQGISSSGRSGRTRALRAVSAALALTAGAAVLPVTSAEARTRPLTCVAGYQNYKESGRFLRTTWEIPVKNKSNSADTVALTVDKSGTISNTLSKSVEASVGGGFGPFQASVTGQFGTEVTESYTAGKGATYTATVPPRTQLRVRYGVWNRRYKGVVLTTPNPNVPRPASPVPLPAGCQLVVTKVYSVSVPESDTGFVKSKPRKLD